MNVLALETATDNCSVALSVAGEEQVLSEPSARQQARRLLPMIEQLLAESGISRTQLDAIAFGKGPGSFTGLRVAAAACQGIAYALELPVAPVSTLAAIAHQQFRLRQQTHCIACIDARMSEVYWGAYVTESLGCNRNVLSDSLNQPAQVPAEFTASSVSELKELADASFAQPNAWQFAGSGASLLQDYFPALGQFDRENGEMLPDALDVLLLGLGVIERGETVAADQALPVYLRDKVALTEAERGQA